MLCTLDVPSGCILCDDRLLKHEAVKDGTIEHLHGCQLEAVKQGAHLLPEGFLRANLFENGLKQCTTELLRLVDQERQHRHFHKDHAHLPVKSSKGLRT